MRRFGIALSMATVALPLLAQGPPPRGRMVRPSMTADAAEAEAAVKQASERLVMAKKACDRDVDVLAHLRAADKALTDPMQPENAVQKAYEEVEAAKMAQPPFVVMQGVIRAERELEGARRSPVSTDFAHLRSVLRDEALGPASRVTVRDAAGLQDEARAWLRVQQLIGDHLRMLTEISSESLRASEQE